MNDYYDIAIGEFTHIINANIYNNDYNVYAANYSNMIEKLLKSIVEIECPGAKTILHSHSLQAIYDTILDAGIDLGIDEALLALVSSFYFDARYPGKNYVHVSERKYKQCGLCAKSVLESVNKYRVEKGLPVRLPKLYKKDVDVNEIWKEYCERYAIKKENEISEKGRLMMVYNCEGEELFKKIKEDLL